MMEDYRAGGSVMGDDRTMEASPARSKKLSSRMWNVMKGLDGLSEPGSSTLAMSPASRRRISAVAVQQTNQVADSSLEETFYGIHH